MKGSKQKFVIAIASLVLVLSLLMFYPIGATHSAVQNPRPVIASLDDCPECEKFEAELQKLFRQPQKAALAVRNPAATSEEIQGILDEYKNLQRLIYQAMTKYVKCVVACCKRKGSCFDLGPDPNEDTAEFDVEKARRYLEDETYKAMNEISHTCWNNFNDFFGKVPETAPSYLESLAKLERKPSLTEEERKRRNSLRDVFKTMEMYDLGKFRDFQECLTRLCNKRCPEPGITTPPPTPPLPPPSPGPSPEPPPTTPGQTNPKPPETAPPVKYEPPPSPRPSPEPPPPTTPGQTNPKPPETAPPVKYEPPLVINTTCETLKADTLHAEQRLRDAQKNGLTADAEKAQAEFRDLYLRWRACEDGVSVYRPDRGIYPLCPKCQKRDQELSELVMREMTTVRDAAQKILNVAGGTGHQKYMLAKALGPELIRAHSLPHLVEDALSDYDSCLKECCQQKQSCRDNVQMPAIAVTCQCENLEQKLLDAQNQYGRAFGDALREMEHILDSFYAYGVRDDFRDKIDLERLGDRDKELAKQFDDALNAYLACLEKCCEANRCTAPVNPPAKNTVGYNTQNKSGNGLNTTVFSTPEGNIRVNLPDDMAAGDTITGTVEVEPNGKNEAERAQNEGELNGYVIEVGGQKTKVGDKKINCIIPATLTPDAKTIVLTRNNQRVATSECPISQTPPPTPTQTTLPTGGQQGRTIECQGNFSPTDQVSIGGTVMPTVASSPRKIIVRNTSQTMGPTTIKVGQQECPFRNIGIKLSAPKLNLQRGETTTLHIVVSGLSGITQPVTGNVVNNTPNVIKMPGGNVPLAIQPGQVQADGTYSLDITLTGIMAGGFGITGTVNWAEVCTRATP